MFLDLKLRSKDTITFTVFYMASTGPVKTRLWMTRYADEAIAVGHQAVTTYK